MSDNPSIEYTQKRGCSKMIVHFVTAPFIVTYYLFGGRPAYSLAKSEKFSLM